MPPRHAHSVGRELRAAYLTHGGRGCTILVTTRGEMSSGAVEWVSPRAWAALERAAERLGFETASGPLVSVARAIVAGCLPDLLSEAIEEVESP